MVAREGSDPHKGGSKMPGIGDTDFPTYHMLLTASMMRHPGVNARRSKLRYRKKNPKRTSYSDSKLTIKEIRKLIHIWSNLVTATKLLF